MGAALASPLLMRTVTMRLPLLALVFSASIGTAAGQEPSIWERTERGGELARECLVHCRDYVRGWLAHADPATGLIPRNLDRSRDYWNGKDSAADNYAFMGCRSVLT